MNEQLLKLVSDYKRLESMEKRSEAETRYFNQLILYVDEIMTDSEFSEYWNSLKGE